MWRHLSYLKYVIRHKWFVLMASRKVGCGLWLALIHDLSKFSPKEWFPYAYTFYDTAGKTRYFENEQFNVAWNHHQKSNKHHWQYWILFMDRGEIEAMKMPEKYVREMIADWMGAGRAITGKNDVHEWYDINKDKMVLHRMTRMMVEDLLKGVY